MLCFDFDGFAKVVVEHYHTQVHVGNTKVQIKYHHMKSWLQVGIVLCNVFTPTRKVLDFQYASQ